MITPLLVGLISEGDETVYRAEVENLSCWDCMLLWAMVWVTFITQATHIQTLYSDQVFLHYFQALCNMFSKVFYIHFFCLVYIYPRIYFSSLLLIPAVYHLYLLFNVAHPQFHCTCTLTIKGYYVLFYFILLYQCSKLCHCARSIAVLKKTLLYSMVLQKRPFFIHYIPHYTWFEKTKQVGKSKNV